MVITPAAPDRCAKAKAPAGKAARASTGIMKWPGKIPAGTTTDTMMMTIDHAAHHRPRHRCQTAGAQNRRLELLAHRRR
jgi:hypothetical protein